MKQIHSIQFHAYLFQKYTHFKIYYDYIDCSPKFFDELEKYMTNTFTFYESIKNQKDLYDYYETYYHVWCDEDIHHIFYIFDEFVKYDFKKIVFYKNRIPIKLLE